MFLAEPFGLQTFSLNCVLGVEDLVKWGIEKAALCREGGMQLQREAEARCMVQQETYYLDLNVFLLRF